MEYFNRVKEYEKQFREGEQPNLPKELSGKKKATAFYNILMEQLKTTVSLPENKDEIVLWALEIASLIDKIIYEDNIPIVDWQQNDLLVNKIKEEIDDYFYHLRQQKDKILSFEIIDSIIESIVKVSKQLGQ